MFDTVNYRRGYIDGISGEPYRPREAYSNDYDVGYAKGKAIHRGERMFTIVASCVISIGLGAVFLAWLAESVKLAV